MSTEGTHPRPQLRFKTDREREAELETEHPQVSTRKHRRAAWRGVRKQYERWGSREDSHLVRTQRWRAAWRGSVLAAERARIDRVFAFHIAGFR